MEKNKLKESRFIEQAMVIGENEKFPAAFVVPAFAFVKEWCAKHNIVYTTNEELIKNPQVIARLMKEVDHTNKDLAHYEQIKKIELLAHEWNIERGEMTPKLSLKRKVIMTANKEAYAAIYNNDNGLR